MGAKWAPEGRVSRLGMDVAWRLVGVKEAAEAEPVFVSSSAGLSTVDLGESSHMSRNRRLFMSFICAILGSCKNVEILEICEGFVYAGWCYGGRFASGSLHSFGNFLSVCVSGFQAVTLLCVLELFM